MVEYKKSLYPIYECLGFIERFVNDTDSFKKFYEYCQSEQEIDMMNRLIKACDIMKKEFYQHFEQYEYLFVYLHKEHPLSCARALFYACLDDQNRSFEDGMAYIKACYEKDPNLFIQEVLSSEKDDWKQEDMKDRELLEIIDNSLLEDGVKWRLFQLHHHIEAFIQNMEEILRYMMPVYHQFDALYQEILKIYEKEQKSVIEGKESYYYVVEKLNLEFSDDRIVVIPTISNMGSVSFIPIKDDDERTCLVVYMGIGTLRRVMQEQEKIDTEVLCSALKLLSDRSKFDILHYIADERAYGAQIANELQLSTPTISYHMQSLLNAKLVSFQKENNRLYYRLNKEYLKELLTQVYQQLTEK